jgi:acyl-CoA thioesterase-1
MRVLPLLAFAAVPVLAQPSLVFLGDSLTAGYGLDRTQAFPSLIEGRLKREGLDWKVVNAGVSGDTSAGALARLDWLYRTRVDVLFLCIGSNDGLRGLPVAQLEKNLRAILDRARREGTQVVLAGAMVPDNYGRAYQDAFRRLYPRLAKEYRLPFLPFLLEPVVREGLFQDDGLHPTAEGARKVAELVWKLLEPRLRTWKPAAK